MTKKTTNKPNAGAPRLIDRNLEGPAQSLIRLADKGLENLAARFLGRISPKKHKAVEKKIQKGYTENLERLRKVGKERGWLSPALKDSVTPSRPSAWRGDDTAVTPYDTHFKAKAVGRSLLRLARGRCRNIALCTRRRTPYNPCAPAEKKARDRYINDMVRLWDLCNGSHAMPPEVWARAMAHGQKTRPPGQPPPCAPIADSVPLKDQAKHKEETHVMTKQKLIAETTQGTKLSKRDAAKFVDRVFDAVKQTVAKEERFAYPRFGTFVLRHRKARDGRNLQTGEKMRIEASKSVGFRPASAFKDSL